MFTLHHIIKPSKLILLHRTKRIVLYLILSFFFFTRNHPRVDGGWEREGDERMLGALPRADSKRKLDVRSFNCRFPFEGE